METVQNLLPERVPVTVLVTGAVILLSALYSFFTRNRAWPHYPLISVRGLGPRRSWMMHGREVLDEGLKQGKGGPFQVMTSGGPKIMLPAKYADEIRNLPELNFPKAFSLDFPTRYPGFEAHKLGLTDEYLMRDTVRIKLTQSLGLVTSDLVDETIATVNDVYGTDSTEWTTRRLKDDMLEIIARVSSRVFLGEDLCRNRRWLEIAKTYTVDTFALAIFMRMVPAIIRPFAYLVLPHSARLRKSVRDARQMIMPEMNKRQAAVDEARAAGEKPPKVMDTLGWMYDVAKGRKVDYVAGQLALTMAALHTTTESTCRAILDLCKHPEIVQQLRDEIIEVVGREGWAKTTLYKLKLMDSFLKESQRVSPLSMTSMNRYVEKPFVLSDGLTIPKGCRVSVVGDWANPETYPEPEEFDVARFLKKRQQPGQENNWQFVTTSATHLNFGHGEHACPGRFFASNEIKIVLCHLLMKFDWRYVPGESEPSPRVFEASLATKPDTLIQARRRKPEIDIDAL